MLFFYFVPLVGIRFFLFGVSNEVIIKLRNGRYYETEHFVVNI